MLQGSHQVEDDERTSEAKLKKWVLTRVVYAELKWSQRA